MTDPEFNRAKLHNRRSNKMTEPEFNRAKEKKSKLISKKINSIHLYSCRCSTYFRH